MNSENINNSTSADFGEISLKEFLSKVKRFYNYLRSKLTLIILFGLVGGVLGFCYANLKKPIYTATTTFVLDEGSSGSGLAGIGGLASMVGVDIAGGASGGIFQGDNILELYKSRTMIEKALLTEVSYRSNKQTLLEYYITFNGLRENWAKNPQLKNIVFDTTQHFTRAQDSIVGKIVEDIKQNNLSVFKPDKKLSIIKALVTSKDEFFAKSFNEQIVKNVNDFYRITKTKKSMENVVLLQHKTDSVRSIMNGAIYTAAEINDATPNLNPTRQVQRVAPVQRSQFNAEINRTILSELVKNLELSKMTLLKDAPLIQVIDRPIFPLDVNKVSKIKGTVVGVFLAVFLVLLILLMIMLIKSINF